MICKNVFMNRLMSCAASAALAASLVPAAATAAFAEELAGSAAAEAAASAGNNAEEELASGEGTATEGGLEAGEGEQGSQDPEEPEAPVTVWTELSQVEPIVSFSCATAQDTWKTPSKSGAAFNSSQTLSLSKNTIQGIKMSITLPANTELSPELAGELGDLNIQYRVKVGGTWSDWAADGKVAGNEGKSIEAVEMRLAEGSKAAELFSLRYRVTAKGCGELGWAVSPATDEEAAISACWAGTNSSSWKLSGLEVKLVSSEKNLPSNKVASYIKTSSLTASCKLVTSAGKVKTASKLGATAGTASKSAKDGVRLAVKSTSAAVSGNLRCRVYQKGKGWSAYASQGSYAGSKSSKAYIMAVRISATGNVGAFYDIYYRVYLKGYGWMGWASNGASAGNIAYEDFPVTAVQVKAVPKGAAAPGKTANCYSTRDGVLKEPAYAKRLQAVAKNMSSSTKYLLLVDTTTCRVGVFTGSKGNWTLKYLWKAGVGAWGSETPKGTYTTVSHSYVFGTEKGYNCWYGTCFDADREILFHSEVYNIGSKTQIQSSGLGTHVSHGCVRLALENAKWIYNNVPFGTKVKVY